MSAWCKHILGSMSRLGCGVIMTIPVIAGCQNQFPPLSSLHYGLSLLQISLQLRLKYTLARESVSNPVTILDKQLARVLRDLQEGVDLETKVDQHVLSSVAQIAAQAHQVGSHLAGNVLDGVLMLTLCLHILLLLQQ